MSCSNSTSSCLRIHTLRWYTFTVVYIVFEKAAWLKFSPSSLRIKILVHVGRSGVEFNGTKDSFIG